MHGTAGCLVEPLPKLYRGAKAGFGYAFWDGSRRTVGRHPMAARALIADPVVPAPGNEGAAANFRCVGGSNAVAEEDIVRWLEQRKGGGMRRQAALTAGLAEDMVAARPRV